MICLVRFLVSLEQMGERAELESELTAMCGRIAELPRLERNEHLNALNFLVDFDLRAKNLAEAEELAVEVVRAGESILPPEQPEPRALPGVPGRLSLRREALRRVREPPAAVPDALPRHAGTRGGPTRACVDGSLAKVAVGAGRGALTLSGSKFLN
jgi:hypothetical protein